MENKTTRMDAVTEARTWLDTPFHHQASVKGSGCDCIGLITWLVEIPVADATLADIYFMAWGREPQHVALITDKGIIHSYSGVGKVVEHALDEDWKRRIVAAYRYPYFVETP